MLLEYLTLVGREGRVPSLMRQHAEATGLDFDEEAMYEPLVELARGKDISTLIIDIDNGEQCGHEAGITRRLISGLQCSIFVFYPSFQDAFHGCDAETSTIYCVRSMYIVFAYINDDSRMLP